MIDLKQKEVSDAIALIKQDYSEECLMMASVQEYVADAVGQLIEAGYRRTQPETPAQDLSAAKKEWRGSLAQVICDVPLPEGSDKYQHGFVTAKETILEVLRKAGFDALSAVDRVDAARYRQLRNSGQIVASSFGNGRISLPAYKPSKEDLGELDAAIDAAILQSQKAK